jgi:hypothetical protein
VVLRASFDRLKRRRKIQASIKAKNKVFPETTYFTTTDLARWFQVPSATGD